MIPLSALEGYLILTEEQFIDIVSEATTGAVGESLREAIKEERTQFLQVETSLRSEISKLSQTVQTQKSVILGLSIGTGVLILGGVGLLVVSLVRK